MNSPGIPTDIAKKREIIGSMFPEKICFYGTKHRTGKVNEAMALSHLINSKLQGKKNGAKSSFFDLPHEEGSLLVQITNRFITDLQAIARFSSTS